MLAQRLPLPAYQRREEIVALCRARGVVVIAGATGCGKSTQVPQLILDDADSRGLGGVTSVVVTQPRRVAAIALAERVSEERSERSCGAGDVGYTVRLEKRGSAQRTRLEFVTVGVLLRRLQYNDGAALQKVSHIIVDEAHERDLLTDFLLVVLKTRLLRQRASGPPLTVVVMSATLDANLFLDYFAQHGAQALDIPGRLHPVETHFIDAALALVATRPPKDVPRSAREGLTAMAKVNFKTPPSANGPNAPPPAIPEYGVDLALAVSLERQTAAKKAVCVLSPEVDKPLDLAAVSAVVVAISRHRAQQRATGAQGVRGAILVFLPGAAEIDKLCRELRNSLRSDEAWVLPMHSGLTTAEQRRVFQRPPGEQTKIVVSTNISETSVTIDDVTDVVDCGRVREMRHENSASKLAEVWTSKASASQRAGRAGRVRAGTCWRLYPKELHEQAMPAHTAPEILRTPLDNLILQILRLGLGQPHVFLKSALQPPSASAIDASIDDLCAIGAVEREGAASLAVADDDEEEDEAESPYADEEEDEALFSLKQAGFGGLAVDEGGSDDDSDDDELAAAAAPDAPVYRLTALGFHISNLPMDCRIAKLLLCAPLLQRACFITDTRCGSIFDCLEPTLTIAAGLSVAKDVFSAPFHKKREATAQKKKLAKDSDSDLIALVFAYQGAIPFWRALVRLHREAGGRLSTRARAASTASSTICRAWLWRKCTACARCSGASSRQQTSPRTKSLLATIPSPSPSSRASSAPDCTRKSRAPSRTRRPAARRGSCSATARGGGAILGRSTSSDSQRGPRASTSSSRSDSARPSPTSWTRVWFHLCL